MEQQEIFFYNLSISEEIFIFLLPLQFAVGVAELDHALVELDAVLLGAGCAGLAGGPEVAAELLAGVEPAEGSLLLQVAGAHPEGVVGEPCEEVLLQPRQLLRVRQLDQVTWWGKISISYYQIMTPWYNVCQILVSFILVKVK